MKVKVKSKQVAKDLGISEATVSLALNNKPGVNEETRKKILDYIENLKNEGRKNASGQCIKLIFFDMERVLYDEEKASLFSVSYLEIFRVVKNAGFSLKMVYVSNEEEVLEAIETSRHDGTVGILLSASDIHESEFEPFRGIEIPLVVNDNAFEDMKCDCIMTDDRQGVRLLMKYLHDMGHRDVLYFYNTNTINIFQRRREAYLECAREWGMADPESSMMEVGTKIEVIHDNVVRFVQSGKKMPTAIIAENYAIAIGAIKAIEDNGYKIPEDISIIGIDELPAYVLLEFKYTCIKVLHVSKANLGTSRLIDKVVNGRKENIQILLATEFVEGNSVKNLNEIV